MMMACWFTIACCCWAKTACWASGGEEEKHSKQEKRTQIMFDEIFFLMFLFTLDTNQVLQVPLQQQEATSRLPQEGLSQLWIHNYTHITILSILSKWVLLHMLMMHGAIEVPPVCGCVPMSKLYSALYLLSTILWECLN